MTQIYSDPRRENEAGALPDVEVFYTSAERGDALSDGNGGAMLPGWYWQVVGTNYRADGSCHPDCGPIVLDVYDFGKAPMLNNKGEHAHENEDGRCWRESWCEPQGPFATEAEAIADARFSAVAESDSYDGCTTVGAVPNADEFPPCVQAMKCYCAGHARGNPASAPCDTSEQFDSEPADGEHCPCGTGEDEPDEEDYYLSDDERSIYYLRKRIVGPVDVDAEPCPQDAVMELLAQYIDGDPGGYAPNVWKISDHGNPILISVQECGCYFTEHRGRACDHNRVHIIASDGSTVLSNSRNLAGLRRAARKYSVRMVTLNLMPEGAGELRVWFSPNIINGKFHGAICVVPFASFVVMCGFVARWRSVQEAESYIAGMARGSVEHAKPLLLSIYNHERLTIDSPDGDVEV